jgi:hypothetical protein
MIEPAGVPALSVILVTPENYHSLRAVVRHLRAQSICHLLEIVIATPSAGALDLDPADLSAFGQYQVVEIGPLVDTPAARAAAVQRCRAPVVVFGEDHCYPAAGWAAALVDAHQNGWAAVGPVFNNANPGLPLSWANLFLEYGPYLEPVSAGTRLDLPGHNSSYKRDLLLAYGDRLGTILEIDSMLHQDLRSRGHQLYLEPAARVFHISMTRLEPAVRETYWYSRCFAAMRARPWPLWRRAVYVLGAPLIPAVRLWRTLPIIRRTGRLWQLPALLPYLLLKLATSAFGELIGVSLGAGDSARRLTELEFKRERYLAAGDAIGEAA